MKKLLLISLLSLFFLSCSNDSEDIEDNYITLTSFDIEEINGSLIIGDLYQMEVLTVPSIKNLKVEWTSSNPEIATVSKDGLLEAKEEGKTTISAQYGTLKSSIIVSVSPKKTYLTIYNNTATIFYKLEIWVPGDDGEWDSYRDIGTLYAGHSSKEIDLDGKYDKIRLYCTETKKLPSHFFPYTYTMYHEFKLQKYERYEYNLGYKMWKTVVE